MRILMLTSDHLMIDRRILQSAQTLIDAGAHVTLLAGFECPKEERYRIGALEVERNVFDWGDTRISRVLDALPLRLEGKPKTAAWIALRKGIAIATGLTSFEHFIVRKMLAHEFDVVHCHDFPILGAALNGARRAGKPVVYDAHELYHAQSTLPAPTRRAYRAHERRLIREVDAAITVNPFIADEMAKDYGVPAPNVILNAMPMQSAPMGPGLRERLGWPESAKIVLYQGWMSAERGIDKLVRAAARFPQNVRLVLVGYGAVEDELKAISAAQGTNDGRVAFFGRVEPEDLAPLTASADLGLIPYNAVDLNHYYCSPNKLFEFIMAGLPFLANDLPYLRSVCETWGVGETTDLQSEDAIARAVGAIFEDSSRYANMKAAALEARKVLNWEVEGAKLVEIYRQRIEPIAAAPLRSAA